MPEQLINREEETDGPEDESRLLALARQGDAAAFESLVDRHKKWAYGLAFRLSGDHFTADEISQEAFVVLYGSLRRFRGEAKVKTYLTRVIINLWRQHLRGVYRQQRLGQALAGRPREGKDLAREVEEEDRAAEFRGKIESAISKLTPAQKKIFVLKHLEGLKISEVAAAVGCREGTVKAHLFNALGTLRKKLR